MSEVFLFPLSALDEPGSKGFDVELDGARLAGFVVRRDATLHAYRNSCPHTGAPLEWQPDQFLDIGGSFIECALHGALFGIDDGRCVRGPCVGQHLQPLTVVIRDDGVWLQGPAAGAEHDDPSASDR